MSISVKEMLNALNAQQNKDNHFTNITKEDLTMKAATTTATTPKNPSRPATFSKSQWDKATYTAYMGLVAIVERRSSIAAFLKANAALFLGCGVPADEEHVLSLVIAMAKDTTVDHEKVRKVNPIGSLRQFFNGAWAAKDALSISYKAPTAPKEPQPRKPKAKKSTEDTVKEYFGKMSPEEKAAFVAKLLGDIAA